MRIVLATFGSHGDVHPFIGLARTLQARGHEVILHTSSYFAPLASQAGVAFSGFGTAQQFSEQINNKMLWHPTKAFKYVFGIGVRQALRPSYEELKKIVTKHTLLVNSSLAFSARILHDEIGCPGATVHLAPAVIRSSINPPKLAGLFMPHWVPMAIKQKIWEGGDRFVIDPIVCPPINELRSELGLPPVSRALHEWWNHPSRVIGMWPEFFGPACGDWPRQFRHTGFPLYDEADVTPLTPQLEAFLSKYPNPIAFTPGSAMLFGQRFFKAAIHASQTLGRPALLLTRHADQIPTPLPPTVTHVPYAPFSRLLPQCSAIVHHGGIGTTAQALAAGIPQVITHFSHDQPDNALRLQRLGVGTGIKAWSLSRRKLVKSLDRLLSDPHTLKAAKATAQRIRHDALVQTAELLEDAARLRPENRPTGHPIETAAL